MQEKYRLTAKKATIFLAQAATAAAAATLTTALSPGPHTASSAWEYCSEAKRESRAGMEPGRTMSPRRYLHGAENSEGENFPKHVVQKKTFSSIFTANLWNDWTLLAMMSIGS